MLPLVVPYRLPDRGRPVTTITTILDRPARCRDCRRLVPVGPLIAGRGRRCARQAGLQPVPRIPRLRPAVHEGPDLLDLLTQQQEGPPT